MPHATVKVVALLAGVAPATVSRVINGSDKVAAATREKILAVIRDLDYTPNIHAANLRRKSWNDKDTSRSSDHSACASNRLRARSDPRVSVPSPAEEAFLFRPDERRALVQQIIRLRSDLDKLSNHTKRIQVCLERRAVADRPAFDLTSVKLSQP